MLFVYLVKSVMEYYEVEIGGWKEKTKLKKV